MLRTVPIERLTALAARLLARLEQRRQSKQSTPAHPARAHIHETATIGERAADALAAFVGSWKFVIWQNVFVLVWILINVVAMFGFHADPYPFILLNLMFSWQASNTGPILQLASNRQAQRDRMRDDTEAAEVEQLFQINQQQLTILEQQNAILALLKAHTAQATTSTATPRKPGRPKKETTAA